ncbi:MAG: phosphatase PAP2 family protein [Deltaproteobacteria bacterium]|nr:phosphatase PAP2 family protein [Deltaproteobacteria bacterium]
MVERSDDDGARGTDEPAALLVEARSGAPRFRELIANAAVHDWITLGFLLLAPTALALTGPTSEPARVRMIGNHALLLAVVLGAVVATRLGYASAPHTAPKPVLARAYLIGTYYRLALAGSLSVTYLLLGDSLLMISSRVLDRPLYLLDLDLFGLEPAVLMERWATPAVTDWFAFFYMCYFVLLLFFLMPVVFFSRSTRLSAEITFTVMMVYSVGQTLYAIVPGYGPLRELVPAFHADLPAGPVFRWMHDVVSGAGAKKDIFPSLHTGIPTALSLIAFRHRKAVGPIWYGVAFITMNTVIATMFLRWHYLIDVIAGLLLAFGTVTLAARVVSWEFERREREGVAPLWPRWPLTEMDP